MDVEQPIVLDKETVLASDSSIPPSKDPSLPTLVLHIGPHKTATSTIQCELTHYMRVLRDSGNFTYLGRQYNECKARAGSHSTFDIDTRALVKCLDRHSDEDPCQETKEWKKFVKMLSTLADAMKRNPLRLLHKEKAAGSINVVGLNA